MLKGIRVVAQPEVILIIAPCFSLAHKPWAKSTILTSFSYLLHLLGLLFLRQILIVEVFLFFLLLHCLQHFKSFSLSYLLFHRLLVHAPLPLLPHLLFNVLLQPLTRLPLQLIDFFDIASDFPKHVDVVIERIGLS